MLIEVPDVETSPFDLIIADHLTHFSMKTLGYALSRAGLRSSLISNKFVPKEVTALATRGAAGIEDFSADDGMNRAKRIVGWIGSVLAHARSTPMDRPIGIFGTSMAGIWLYGAMKDCVKFFVDEDAAKVGNEVNGLPIFHPAKVPTKVRILVPLAPSVAERVVQRWGSSDREYVALGQIPQRFPRR